MLTTRSVHRSFGGEQGYYEHHSAACDGPMRFAVYVPPAALAGARVPVLYYLAGLTCTEETFVIKGGAQRVAAELGLMLVTCDTSPRAARFAGDDERWDFGQGAGFYLDATQSPWSSAYRMRTYVTRELRDAVEASFPARTDRRGIFGHSMGGHGALVLALTTDLYASVSALAPISAASEVPWGEYAFTRYLGDDRATWRAHDVTALLEAGHRLPSPALVDQGNADKFLVEQLKPERLVEAAAKAKQPLELRRHDGYDHSYFFVSTFAEDHVRHHARLLLDG
jgi:S-formylglutathione hydrolase